MPTKRNKAGQQQPYVPQGNGDASGEYADNQSGSNKHFTNFKQPGEEITAKGETTDLSNENNENEIIKETQIEKPKKDINTTIIPQLTDAQKIAIASSLTPYKNGTRQFDMKSFLLRLRWYGGSYGDLSKYTNEELADMVNYIRELDDTESQDRVFYKKGKQWFGTTHKQLFDALGLKTYTDEEMKAAIEQKHQKDITMSKVQKEITDKIRQTGYKGTLSFKGLNDENSKQVGDAIVETFNDFPALKDNLVSFGTETGVKAEVEESYRKHTQTEEYKVKLEKYKQKLLEWNKGKTFTYEEVERLYKNLYINDNTHTSSGAFWGVCGTENINSDRSWVQLKNTKYAKYQKSNEESIARRGYPNNIGANFKATTYHELGHAICNFVLGSSVFGGYRDSATVDKIKEIRQKYNKPISSYGKTNISEYIAECFASHYTEKNNEQANEVFNVIYNRYKEKMR